MGIGVVFWPSEEGDCSTDATAPVESVAILILVKSYICADSISGKVHFVPRSHESQQFGVDVFYVKISPGAQVNSKFFELFLNCIL